MGGRPKGLNPPLGATGRATRPDSPVKGTE